MHITTKGQVTIPQHIRDKFGFLPHTEVEFVEENGKILKIDNPIGLFKNILSLGNDFKKVQREWEG